MPSSASIYVFGALNLDVSGVPTAALRPGDSNPGSIRLAAGGVGHNMALHLARAGEAVELVAPLGDDIAATILARHCAEAGIGLRHAVRLPGPSSAYLCVHDEAGDLAIAINDMALLETLTPQALAPALSRLVGASLAVADANLPGETLAHLAHSLRVPLLLDPVSTFKAERARPILSRLAAIKPNRLEAASLSGEEDPADAARWLLGEGVGRVFISLGAQGIYYADAGVCGLAPAPPMRAQITNGAGDASAAGLALGMLRGLDTPACAALGIQVATDHLLMQGGTLL